MPAPAPARDSPAWIKAKACGDLAELAVSELFSRMGFAVSREAGPEAGPASFDLLATARIEVKNDAHAARTGRVAVEVSHRGKPSGLSVTTAHLWAFIVGPVAFFVPTRVLRRLVADLPDVNAAESNLVRLVPIHALLNAGAMKLRLPNVEPDYYDF